MHTIQRTLPAALAALALLAGAPGAAASAQELAENDLKELGRALSGYIEDVGSKDQDKSREKVLQSLERAGKRVAEKGTDPVQAALARTASLGKALWLAGDYKGQKGGSITTVPVGDRRNPSFTYAMWVPDGYKPSSGPYPLLIAVPPMKDGKPMTGEQFLQEHWLDSAVRGAAVIAAPDMPENVEEWTQNAGIGRLMQTFAHVRDEVAIDFDRVYLVGRGEGVHAALSLAAMFPHLFAGVVGRAGDAGAVRAENFSNLPTFFQGGGAQATEFAEKAKTLGWSNVTLKPEAAEAEIWAWIQEHPRVANPTKVVLHPGSPFPARAYWIDTPPTEGSGTSVVAEADKAANAIRIQSEGVYNITLYLNDSIVDLSKPVKIVLNGREQEVVIPRSVDDMLNLILRGTNDPGRFYVAARVFDVPQ
jgi:hypothetical protein